MMTELSEVQAELSSCFENLFELSLIFTLVLNQFPEKPTEAWQKQVIWLIDNLAGEVDRNADVIRGQTYAIERLQQTVLSEVSQ